MEEQRRENKMGVQPVGKLLISMSLPVMVSMLVQALYNIVDSIFVAQLSENALRAVSLAFPVQNLIIAVGVGTGVGINSLVSRRLGERRFEEANKAAENGVFLGVCSWLVFAVLGLLFSRPFFQLFTTNQEVIQMGVDYLVVCTVFSFGSFLQLVTERILQATGITIYNMITQGTGAIINIIFDPIFIFGYFGVPAMGVKGAAIATVMGQIVAMILGFVFNYYKNVEVRMNFRGFRPDGRIIRDIYRVGLPSIVMQSIATPMTMGINKILTGLNEVAVSVFGVYFKLQSFVFMPVFGLTNGMVPIVAYNYGARHRDRILGTIRHALCYSVGIMVVGILVFQLVPDRLLLLFDSSEDQQLLTLGIPALRIISISFPLAGVGIIFSSVFQAVGNGGLSLIMSLVRQLVVILPVAWLLARWAGLGAVWFAFPFAELFSVGLAVLMFRSFYQNRIRSLGTAQNTL